MGKDYNQKEPSTHNDNGNIKEALGRVIDERNYWKEVD